MIETLPRYGVGQLRESIGVFECKLKKARGDIRRRDRVGAGIHTLGNDRAGA